MKKSALLILVLGAILPARASLIAFYPLNGDATDSSGNGNNGTPTNVSFVAGYELQAASFNGSDSSIAIPVNINPTVMPNLTMGAWANTNTVAAIQTVLSHDDGGFDRDLNIDTRGGGVVAWSAFTGSTVLGGSAVAADTWTFVAVRYQASGSGSITLFVDGNSYSTTGAPGTGFNTTLIGSNPGFGEYFSGLIDNAFIFDQALTDQQIASIRAGGADAILALGAEGSLIPEPSTFLLAGAALAALAAMRRR
jgi:hypothetical protein